MDKTVFKWSLTRDCRIVVTPEPREDQPDITIVMRRFIIVLKAKASIPKAKHLLEVRQDVERHLPDGLEHLTSLIVITYADFNLPIDEHEFRVFTMGSSHLRDFLDHVEAAFDRTWIRR